MYYTEKELEILEEVRLKEESYYRKDGNGYLRRDRDYEYRKLRAVRNAVHRYFNENPQCINYSDELKESIAKAYMQFCLYPEGDINDLEENNHISLSAAIWVLDELKRTNCLTKAMPILDSLTVINPAGNSALVIHDLIHDEDLIFNMAAIIRYRNTFDAKQDVDHHLYSVADPYCARGEKNETGALRKEFDGIMALLDKERIESVVANTKKRFAAERDRRLQMTVEKTEKFFRLKKRVNKLDYTREQMKEETEEYFKAQRTKSFKSSSSVGISLPKSITGGIQDSEVSKRLQEIKDISNEINRLNDKAVEHMSMVHHLHVPSSPFSYCDKDYLKDYFDEEYIDEIYMNDPPDPYETHFAMIYMLDNNDEAAWESIWSNKVCSQAADTLPWCAPRLTDEAEGVTIDNVIPDPSFQLGIDEWNKRRFYHVGYDEEEEEEAKLRITLGQILFELTSTIPPRFIPDEGFLDFARKNNIPDSHDVASIFSYLSEFSKRLTSRAVISHSEEESYQKDMLVREVERLRKENQKLEEQVKRLKQENKKLADISHAAEKRLSKECAQRIQDQTSWNEDLQELAALREFVFSLNNENDEKKESERDSLTGPISVKGRILIVGGHDSWLTAFKPQIDGNVSYIDRNTSSFNQDLVRNADAIFIKTNAIGHSLYKPLINTARRYNRKVYYLNSASAAKDVAEISKICG